MNKSNLVGIYIGETGYFDGCTKGREYSLEEYNEKQYMVNCNDLGISSFKNKSKFIVKEEK